MDRLQRLFFKYRGVLKTAVLLCALFIAILSKSERVRSLSLGVAAGIVVIEFVESVDRISRADSKKMSGE